MNTDGKQGTVAMHPSGKPASLSSSSSLSPSQQEPSEQEDQQQLNSSQPKVQSSEPIPATTATTIIPSSYSHPSRGQSSTSLPNASTPLLPIQVTGDLTLKSSAPVPELVSAAKAEAVFSDTNNNLGTSDDKRSIKSTKTENSTSSSASKALEKIIQQSGSPTVPLSSPTPKDTEPYLTPPTETDQFAPTTPIATTSPPPFASMPFTGTIFEGHASSPSSPSLAPAGATSNCSESLAKKPRTAASRLSKEETTSRRSSLSMLTGWWSGSNTCSMTTLTSFETTQEETTSTTNTITDHDRDVAMRTNQPEEAEEALKNIPQDSPMEIDTTLPAAAVPAALADGTIGSRETLDWEPSGLERVVLERIKASEFRDGTSPSSTSLPSSLPSNLTSSFPASMIKSSGKASSVMERRGSTSSSHSHVTSSSWWAIWSTSNVSGNNTNDPTLANDKSQAQYLQPHITPQLSSLAKDVITASELDLEQLERHDSMSSSSDENQSSAATAAHSDGGLLIAATNGTEQPPQQQRQASKRWTIFGYGGSGNNSSSTSLSSPSSKDETNQTDPSTTLASDHASGPTILKTSVAAPNTDPEAPNSKVSVVAKDKDGPLGEAPLTAPALVSTAEVDVTVQSGTPLTKDKEEKSITTAPTSIKKESTALVPAGSSYSGWLSVIPGFGNKTTDDTQSQRRVLEEASLSHQVTDYEEGERHDIHGNVIKFEQADENDDVSSNKTTFAQVAKEKRKHGKDGDGNPPPSSASSDRQTFAQLKEKETEKGSLVKEVAGKAAATLSKMVKPKNMVLPAYYDQFPDARECLLTLPVGPADISVSEGGGGHKRRGSIMSSAVDVLSAILFPKVTKREQELKAKARAEAQANSRRAQRQIHRGAGSVRKVVIFGIHGWFPTKLVRTVIGEPTGTSKKFCEEMDLALKDYLKANKVEIPEENITLIPLEGEGKVLDRVELLYKNLMKNADWCKALHEADLVLVATHSQGTPTSILLVSRLIEEGLIRVKEDDPTMQQVGMLTMAGISHGPFPFLKGNLIVRWFEAEAAGELFEFMDSETGIAKRFWQAIKIVLSSGVRLTCVASLEDQVVPMYSAVMTSISHPSIVRAVYIDGISYQDDFLTNLISFSLRLRNAGIDDHGVLVHLSEVVAGSLYGEGHSTIYDEREVYLLAIRALLEPPSRLTPDKARSEPVMTPFKARQRLNPFYLPWGMRGIMEEVKQLGDEYLTKELERLKQLYDDWAPVSKGMKEIKFRLEPVRSKL